MKPIAHFTYSKKMKICATFIVVLSMACSSMEENTQEINSLEVSMIIDGNIDLDHIFTAVDAVVDNERKIFVLDYVRMAILVFSEEGDFLYEFGKQGEGPGEFSSLYCNFDLDESGLVYAIDNWNRINIFNNDGSYRSRIETGVGQIFDIAAVDSNRIYVNAFPGAVQLLNVSSVPAVLLLDANGNVIREVGLLETDLEDARQKKMYFSPSVTILMRQFSYL